MIDDLEVAHFNSGEFWPSTGLVSRNDFGLGALPIDQKIIRKDFLEERGIGGELGLVQTLLERSDLVYSAHAGAPARFGTRSGQLNAAGA